jgi:hypothetical protein
MPATITDLGQKVKAKYPGQYDDLPDDEVGRRVKTKFPGAYDDFADAAPKQTEAFKQPEGSAVTRAAGGFLKNTLGGIGQTAKMLIQNAPMMLGAPPTPEAVDAVRGVVQGQTDQAQKAKAAWQGGNRVEAIGHGLAAAVPLVGPVAAHAGERMGGEAPKLDRYGNVLEQGQAPDIAGGLGEAAGLIVASSPKNLGAPIARGIAKGAGKLVPERMTPEGMYQSSLRPSLAKKNLPKIDKEVQTGLREAIPVGKKGLEKTTGTIDDINAEIANRIQTKSNQLGPVISPGKVAQRVEDVRPTFEQQVNPEPDLTALDKSKQQFIEKHSTAAPYTKIAPNPYGNGAGQGGFVPNGTGVTRIEEPMTLAEAQAEKQGTYTQLRKKYGELGSADVEAQKSLARGLKEEIASRVPELAGLNARDSALIDLQSQLEKMVAREGNKNLLGLVPATMSHNPFGFLATLMLDNPAIKSRVAIALDRARRVRPPAARVGQGVAAAIPGAAVNQANEPPRLGPPQP